MSSYSAGSTFNLPGPGILEITGANGLALRQGIAAAVGGLSICNIVWLGHSVVQGYLATLYTDAFARQTMSQLAATLGLANPPGYFPLSTNVSYGAGMAWAIAPGALNLVEDSGFAGEAAYIPVGSTATSVTVNPSTGIWLHCQKGPALGGSFTYTVNGGAAQGPVNAGAAPRHGGVIWEHGAAGGLVVGGSNTVVITPNVTFGSVIEGITFFNTNHPTTRPQGFITQANANTGFGLRSWTAGHFGYTTQQFAVAGFKSPITGSPNSQALFTDPMQFINPHAVIIMLGINDIVAGYSPQTFIDNIRTMVSLIQLSATTYSYRMPTLVFMANFGTVSDTTNQYLLYENALKTYCYSQGYAYLDLASMIGQINGNTVITSDNIHPNTLGHRMIANYLAHFLLDV